MADSNDQQTQAVPVAMAVDVVQGGSLLLSIDYIWNEHPELKELLQGFITECVRTIAPEAGRHQLARSSSPPSGFAVKFRCTTAIVVPEEVFCTAVDICRHDMLKPMVEQMQ